MRVSKHLVSLNDGIYYMHIKEELPVEFLVFLKVILDNLYGEE